MASTWDDRYVKCPFYKSHSNMSISCESIFASSSTLTMQFSKKQLRVEHMQKFCNCAYKECDINRLCEKKYK